MKNSNFIWTNKNKATFFTKAFYNFLSFIQLKIEKINGFDFYKTFTNDQNVLFNYKLSINLYNF